MKGRSLASHMNVQHLAQASLPHKPSVDGPLEGHNVKGAQLHRDPDTSRSRDHPQVAQVNNR